ncbi:hypothetical protein B484DRAFT_447974 [Ochromonadaceae sp. CCMP2298]|nr:hypothetical protein B484DRAFT_447974 [Ochromonadaceae sp. CCMP2298]
MLSTRDHAEVKRSSSALPGVASGEIVQHNFHSDRTSSCATLQRTVTQPDPPLDWAAFLGSWGPFALAFAPYLSNREIFNLATCSRKLLGLGRWKFNMDYDTYERFCARRLLLYERNSTSLSRQQETSTSLRIWAPV